MEIFKQLMILMAFNLAGDSISKVLNINIPGSVIGMLMLFFVLHFKFLKLEKVEMVGNFLLNNLPIFFVASGVGIMAKFGLIKPIIISFVGIAVFTTIISLTVLALVAKYIMRKYEGDKNE